MKKFLIALLVAALVMPMGLAYARAGLDGDGGDIGGKAYDWSPERTFRWVRYIPETQSNTSATLSAESIVIWSLTSADGVTVTRTTTSGDTAVAGVVKWAILTHEAGTWGNTAQEDYGKRNWGWLQTYGLGEVHIWSPDAVATAGWAFGTGATVTQAAGWGLSGTNTSTSPADKGNAGVLLESVTTATENVAVFIKCQ